MNKLKLLPKLKKVYKSGGNIIQFLKQGAKRRNNPEDIKIAYDFQAGSYTRLAQKNRAYLDAYTSALKKIFDRIPDFHSILEVGVGEATLMGPLMQKIDPKNTFKKYGFDLSWSRLRFAKENLQKRKNNAALFMANLFEIPLPDNSIDIVYTSHSLEPNGGNELSALKELHRISRKYIILLEPDYKYASRQGKQRMRRHGYVEDLRGAAKKLNYQVKEHRLFEVSINPSNPTALTIIKINKSSTVYKRPSFVCPVTKTPLKKYGNFLFSKKAGLIYPILKSIPCLERRNSILALQFRN